jgi:hypothetical protein
MEGLVVLAVLKQTTSIAAAMHQVADARSLVVLMKGLVVVVKGLVVLVKALKLALNRVLDLYQSMALDQVLSAMTVTMSRAVAL